LKVAEQMQDAAHFDVVFGAIRDAQGSSSAILAIAPATVYAGVTKIMFSMSATLSPSASSWSIARR
jgi:hypothetical protein